MDGYENRLETWIDALERALGGDEYDEYLSGRLSGVKSALGSYRVYKRMVGGD